MSYFGIDLGTTNSCLARYDELRKQAVTITNNNESAQTLPSIVAFDPATPGVVSVGRSAKAILEYSPTTGIEFVKRFMGDDNVLLTLDDGTELRPQDISALILKQIKAYGEESTGETIEDVVVTVPAYFGWAEREATRKAVEATGMHLRSLIDEPTAAALSYFENYSGTEPLNVFVYDLGGGTFDVSAVKMNFNPDGTQQVEVLTFDGNHRLGGMDWDLRLFKVVMDKIMAENPDLEMEDEDTNLIRGKIEDLKKRLSSSPVAPFRANVQGKRINIQVTKEEFEAATADLLDQTRSLCEGVLAHRKMAGVNVDRVLLVGGSSLMPMVGDMVKSIFPDKEILLADPHQSVAKGACIACYMGLGDTAIYGTDEDTETPAENGGTSEGESGDVTNLKPEKPAVVPVVPKSVGFRLFNPATNTRPVNTRIFRGTPMEDDGHLLVTIDDYSPVKDNMARVVIAAFELNNDDPSLEMIEVDWADDKYQEVNEANNPYGVRYMGQLELPLEPNTPAGAHLRLLIDVSTTGLRMECYNADTNGTHYDVTIEMVTAPQVEVINRFGLEGE